MKIIGLIFSTVGSIAFFVCSVQPANAAGKYALAFWREAAAYENQAPPAGEFGNHSVFVHVWDESGQGLSGKRIVNSQGALMGITDVYGYVEIPVPMGSGYDFRVSDGSHASDTTPAFSTQRAPNWGHYSFEVGFLFKANAADPGTFDTNYAGVLNASGDQPCPYLSAPHTRSLAYYSTDPNDYCSDQHQLGEWADFHGQTFVATGNRIVAMKAYMAAGFGVSHYWTVQIHEGGPDGPAIGPPLNTRTHLDAEYYQILITWGMADVQVVPGRTYFMKITRPGGLNAWRLNRNNYPNGNYYENNLSVPGTELMGLVVCAHYTNAGPSGLLIGTVTDTNSHPVPGVVVRIPSVDLYATTSSNGLYTLSSVPVGSYAVTATKPGYAIATNTSVVISAGTISRSDFELTPLSQENGGVITNGSSLLQPFEMEPDWTSTFDAPWGSGAFFDVVPGGQSGRALQASRSSPGSSICVQVFPVTPNTPYEVAVWSRCPAFASSYWTSCAFQLGSHNAQEFDEDSDAWTAVSYFSDSGPNGNGNQWTRYASTLNSGPSTLLSVGFKLGALTGSGPVVGWDQLSVVSLVLPAVTSAVATSASNVVFSFAEPVSPDAAADLTHYQLTCPTGPLAVFGATSEDALQVTLATASQLPGTDYTLTVSNVTTPLQPLSLTGLNGQLPVRVSVPILPLNAEESVLWKFNDSGASQSFFWRNLSFNDAAWPEAPGPFGLAAGPLPLPIRTALAPDTNRVTVYFRKRFEVPAAMAGAGLRLRFLLDDGAMFWLNGQHVFHLGMPATTPGSATLATREVDTPDWEGPFDLLERGLLAGTNLLAVEVHQANPLDPDVVFGADIQALALPSQVPPSPVPLTITALTDSVVLDWPEPSLTLEQATNLLGPWIPLPDSTSPASIPMTNQTTFFRLRP